MAVLVNIEGETAIYISVEITAVGDLLFSGHDMGKAPMELFGDGDHEYWLKIPKTQKDAVLFALIDEHYSGESSKICPLLPVELKKAIVSSARTDSDWSKLPASHKDKLLLMLIEESYAGEPCLISDFRKLLKSRDIVSEFFSYS